MSAHKAEFIDRPAGARERLALTNPLFDEAALARAEAAFVELEDQFGDWLDADVARLLEARDGARAADWNEATITALATAAHNLKGVGATYGYPIITHMAALLCRLVEAPDTRERRACAFALIEAHVDAIRAAVRERVKDEVNPLGRALLSALAERVAAYAPAES